MPIFKNHRGQFHKTNTALVAFTAMYVIGGLVILSTPFWRPSTCKLAAFATTPLGIGVVVVVTSLLAGLAMYAIFRNNEISELKAPKIVKGNDGDPVLQMTKEVYKEITANNQNKDKGGKTVEGEYRINFSLKGKDYYVTGKIGDGKAEFGDTVLLNINSLIAKDGDNLTEIKEANKQLITLDLNKDENKGVNTYLGSLIVEQVASQKPQKS